MPQHTVTQTYQAASGGFTAITAVSSTVELDADVVLNVGATNIELDVAFVRANAKSLCLFCTSAATVYTNAASTGAPADTVALTAGVPVICASSAAITALLSHADVTKLFLTCATGGTFSLRSIIQDH